MGMGGFNWEDHYIYYCGQKSLRSNGVTLIANKRVQNALLGCIMKNDRVISVHFQGKPYIIYSNPSLYHNHWHWRNWSWPFLGRTTSYSTTTPKKRCSFHYRGLECISRESRDTWSNRYIWPWSTQWSRSKTKRVLSRECTGHRKHLLPTTQEKTLQMDITRWSIPK